MNILGWIADLFVPPPTARDIEALRVATALQGLEAARPTELAPLKPGDEYFLMTDDLQESWGANCYSRAEIGYLMQIRSDPPIRFVIGEDGSTRRDDSWRPPGRVSDVRVKQWPPGSNAAAQSRSVGQNVLPGRFPSSSLSIADQVGRDMPT
jgi:hypothetical protein